MTQMVFTENKRWAHTSLNSFVFSTEITNAQSNVDLDKYRKVCNVSFTTQNYKPTKIVIGEPSITTQETIGNLCFNGSLLTDTLQTPSNTMTSWRLSGEEIVPLGEKGTGYNELHSNWVSITKDGYGAGEGEVKKDNWNELNWNDVDSEPILYVKHLDELGDPVTLTYMDCKLAESTSISNSFREERKGLEARIKIVQVQYIDVLNITEIGGITAGLDIVTEIPIVGLNYNDDPEGIDDLDFGVKKWVLTEFSVTPIGSYGDKLGRIKFKWEKWSDWVSWRS